MLGLSFSPFTMIETFVAFVLALTLHNCAQALMAAALGDRTPVNKGRFSFLPVPTCKSWEKRQRDTGRVLMESTCLCAKIKSP